MRLAFVVPRYGPEVIGGAETLVRGAATRLAERGHAVEVLTTCAVDHTTWRNVLPPGDAVDRGVRIRRFPVTEPRDEALLFSAHARLVNGFDLPVEEQHRWLRQAGGSTVLLDAVEVTATRVDAVVFAPYLAATTVDGIARAGQRAVVIPCLHDEPYARFAPVRDALAAAAMLLLNSRAEGFLLQELLGVDTPAHRVVGVAVEPVAGVDGARFRARHGLDGDLVTWVGRREGAKRFPLLMAWVAAHGLLLAPDRPVRLAAVGPGAIRIPAAAAALIADLGVLDAGDRLDAMAAAVAVAQLSRNESFSLAIMEGWLCGTPCIVAADAPVTREHCEESGGGLWVAGVEEFSAALDRLAGDPALRRRMGAAGGRYAASHYAPAAVTDRLEAALAEVHA